MSKGSTPSTPAVRALRAAGVEFVPHFYRYQEHGGTEVAARELGVSEACVVKTLIFEREDSQPLIVLMPGVQEVSTRQLARAIGCRSVAPCKPDIASRHSGYLIGGISPFGTRKSMPVYMERSILDQPRIYLNGGSRGFLVEITPQDILRLLQPTLVDAGIFG